MAAESLQGFQDYNEITCFSSLWALREYAGARLLSIIIVVSCYLLVKNSEK